jgi:AmmeMemoRadiSam system protein B
MSVRRPCVAGMFYPADPRRLRQEIEACFKHELGPGKLPGKPERPRSITAIVCPHAGYMYSGPVAAHGYLSLSEEEKADTFIVIGPNHTGYGTPVSMMGQGSWETPLGKVDVDSELAQLIFKASDVIDLDETAHIREHSVEVQLPFLQYLYGSDLKIIPICMGFQDLETSREVGRVLATSVKGRSVVIIASTDLNHQEPQESTNRKDGLVLEAIRGMDEEALQDVVHKHRISMCGYGPVSVAIAASKLLGADRAEVLSHHTSGDITGDLDAVVGYASARITRTVQ